MPLYLLLAAAGSSGRAFACNPRFCLVAQGASQRQSQQFYPQLFRLPDSTRLLYTRSPLRYVDSQHATAEVSEPANLPQHRKALPLTSSVQDPQNHTSHSVQGDTPPEQHLPWIYPPRRFPIRFNKTRRELKAGKQSGVTRILDAIDIATREKYTNRPASKPDLSYVSRRGRRRVVNGQQGVKPDRLPISLYTILTQHILRTKQSPTEEDPYVYDNRELSCLQNAGYSIQDVEYWASLIDEPDSRKASTLFHAKSLPPPLFITLLFLRRHDIGHLALGAVMRHINRSIEQRLTWTSLKLLIIRLVRHARRLWPTSMPWIASLYTSEASRIRKELLDTEQLPTSMVSEMNSFSNTFLSLLSLSCSVNPILSAHYQEKAQFQVLAFMASSDPPLIVTAHGFRAIARVQLARPKTTQERDWAILKGPGWPPWKESRTGVDEEKGYMYGSSRATRILHRMYEAGYPGTNVENVIEMYAGWDTDHSPTIQTRAMLPHMSLALGDPKNYETVLWAARIRTTRTRREAWACFLAFEASGTPAHERVYHAMFERLAAAELHHGQTNTALVPGDTKDISPDSSNASNLVSISEPIPSLAQFYDRLKRKDIIPTKSFLNFLISSGPDHSLFWEVVNDVGSQHNESVRKLLDATFGADKLPKHLLTAFIQGLCKTGRFTQLPTLHPTIRETRAHRLILRDDLDYRLGYAHALLIKFRPQSRPAWTAYMEALIFRPWKTPKGHGARTSALQYGIMTDLIDLMHTTGLDLDDEQFQLVCIATYNTARNLNRRNELHQHGNFTLTSASTRIRTLFHDLTSSTLPPPTNHPTKPPPNLPHQIPRPAALHAYVRALGALTDYEGLYSFSTWLTQNHEDVTHRVHQQLGGPKLLTNTLVALRAGLEGCLAPGQKGAPGDLVELVRGQVEGVGEWGGWPGEGDVEGYLGRRRG